MRKFLLFLSLLLINWMALPFLANGQERVGTKPTSETIQRYQSDSRRFKHLSPFRKEVNLKLASKLLKSPSGISVPDKSAYGYLLPGMKVGLSTFKMSEPTQITTLYPVDIAEEPHISGGAYANGKYYSYYIQIMPYGTVPVSFGYMDIETGDITDLANYASVPFYLADMTYDYSTETMYALYEDLITQAYSLAEVDLENGEVKQIAPLEEKYFCLAATYDGILYGINASGNLVILNKKNGRASVVGNTGIKPQFYQSMDFDHTDGTLYWAASDTAYNGYFCTVNLSNGKATVIDKLGDNDEIVGLYIPYILPAEDTPGAVTGLQVVPGKKGALTAKLSWTNPAAAFGGGTLSGLTKVEVYRDNELVHTESSVTAGQAMAWEDTGLSKGMHVYRVISYNSAGKGATASALGYIGRDVPAAVSNILLEKVNATTAQLSWKAPAEGIYGGWIDDASLTYRITRYPDEKVITEGLTKTEYTDNTLTVLNRYSYLIETFTADGSGDKAVSQAVVIGPALTMPYSTTFKDDSETDIWTVLDNDKDGYSWEFNSRVDVMFIGTSKTGADLIAGGVENRQYDDWLISPNIKFEKGKTYRVMFDMRTMEGAASSIKVTLGKGATLQAQTIDLGNYEVSTSRGQEYGIALPNNLESGEYNIGFHLASEMNAPIIQINTVKVEENHAGHITGKVSDKGTGAGIEAATVSLLQNGKTVLSSQTDANGKYLIQWAEAGDYELSVDKGGYGIVKKNIRIEALKTVTENVSLTVLPTYTLTGKVVDASGAPIEGAEVEISGYGHYTVSTDAQGTFNIPSLYQSSGYYITIYKPLYYPHHAILSMMKDENLGTMSLHANAIPPTQATAEAGEEAVEIVWEAPVETTAFRYDSNTPTSEVGLADGNEYSIFGSVHTTPALLRSMSWMMNASGGPHYKVNVYVMDLDDQDRPTSKVLFSAKGVDNVDGDWFSYTFPHPVEAPNGFMIAVSYDNGNLALGTSESTDEYPFVENVNFYSSDYRSGNYISLEGVGTEENLMIRAEGIPLYRPSNSPALNKAAVVPTATYTIYRLKSGEEENRTAWQQIVSGVTTTSYTDNTWNQAESGAYRYGVVAVYGNQTESMPAFTGEVFKDMNTEVSIHIDLADGKPLNFAAATLENIDKPEHSEMLPFDENGDLEVTLLQGYYKITIAAMGYKKLILDRVDLSTEKRYGLNYTLYPEGPTPYNLKVDSSTGNSCTVSWNNKLGIFDDFEGHEDFAVNSPGEAGWTYIDGDGLNTEEIGGMSYPHEGEKMAYIVMNPSFIEDAGELMQPYSGSKYLTSIIVQGKNDDYLVSPELKFDKDFVLSFYAKSYTDMYGLEQVRIGYSTGGNKKEDFIWLTQKPVEVEAEWTNYVYGIPAEAKYVTINCVSKERFFFMLDDVFIGSRGEMENRTYDFAGITYSVYLDNIKVGTTAETTYTFTGLSEGKHTIGVQANYEEGFSEIIMLVINDPSNIGQQKDDAVIKVYPNPVNDRLYIGGQYDKLSIYNINGTVISEYDNSVSSIDVTNLNTGVYMVKIISGGKTLTKKLVVNHK